MPDSPPGILFINGTLPPPYGGVSTFMGVFLPDLVRRGHAVWTIMPRNYSAEDYSAYEAQGVNVCVPPSQRGRGRFWLVFNALSLLLRHLPWIVGRCLRHRLPLKEALIALYAYLPEAERILREHGDRIAIIHVMNHPWKEGWVGRILARRYRKKLFITTFGEVVPHRDPLTLIDAHSARYRAFTREIVRAADRLTSMTAYCAGNLAYLDVPPERVYRLNFVAGMEAFLTPPAPPQTLDTAYPVLRGRRVVLFAGQIRPRKGPDVLLRAMPDIIAQHPDALAVFVGPDHGMVAALQAEAARLGITDSVLFTGPIPQADLITFYHRAAVFVFPTVAWIECLGLSFVQAMFAGVPVVAAAISAVPEVIRDGENGLVVPPGESPVLAAQVNRLLADPALSARLAAQGRADVQRQFAPEVVAEQTTALYAGL